MDEKAALARFEALEAELFKLRQDNLNLETAIINYQAFVSKIPTELPGGTELTQYEWLEWAKKELGYDILDSEN